MAIQKRSIGSAMRELRRKKVCHSVPTRIPDRMVNSIRQSMRVEGYEVSAEETRSAIQQTLDRRQQR